MSRLSMQGLVRTIQKQGQVVNSLDGVILDFEVLFSFEDLSQFSSSSF